MPTFTYVSDFGAAVSSKPSVTVVKFGDLEIALILMQMRLKHSLMHGLVLNHLTGHHHQAAAPNGYAANGAGR
jgi:hypothetical protein